MTNAELVNALRFCADADSGSGCAGCTVDDWVDCCGRLLRDAADALETSEKRIAELKRQNGEQLTRNVMLVAQLPKDGEWIQTGKNLAACSNCWNSVLRERIDGMFYCPNCGAKMKDDLE